jgi:hypothetical protein
MTTLLAEPEPDPADVAFMQFRYDTADRLHEATGRYDAVARFWIMTEPCAPEWVHDGC